VSVQITLKSEWRNPFGKKKQNEKKKKKKKVTVYSVEEGSSIQKEVASPSDNRGKKRGKKEKSDGFPTGTKKASGSKKKENEGKKKSRVYVVDRKSISAASEGGHVACMKKQVNEDVRRVLNQRERLKRKSPSCG